MAINTTGSGTTIDGVTVVHPDNMGNTLVFKDKVYNVNVGDTLTVGEDGLVDVKLSNESGNLLQIKDDGLYYGNRPPANLSNLYVDYENGVDQHPDQVDGAGTRAKPLKTIAYAVSISKEHTDYTIWLRENQEHIVDHYKGVSFKRGNITIYPYGSLVDSLLKTLPHRTAVHVELCNQRKNPVIRFTGHRIEVDNGVPDIGYVRTTCMHIPVNSSVNLDGVSMCNMQETFIAPNSEITRFHVRTYCRITCVGRFYFTRGLLFNEGVAPIINGVAQATRGLSHFGFVYTVNAFCTWYHIANDNEALTCFLNTPAGASATLGSGSSIDVQAGDEELCNFVGKRIYGAIIDNQNGVRFVVAPSTNLRARYFP